MIVQISTEYAVRVPQALGKIQRSRLEQNLGRIDRPGREHDRTTGNPRCAVRLNVLYKNRHDALGRSRPFQLNGPRTKANLQMARSSRGLYQANKRVEHRSAERQRRP